MEHTTQSIIEATYGNPSSELDRYYRAKVAGYYNMAGISPGQQQKNFADRIKEQRALLESLVSTLRLQLPEDEIQGAYDPGDEYAFYRDLSSLVQGATKNILIVDAYLDEDVFNLYVSKVSATVMVRILSNRLTHNVLTVAGMYVRSRPLELRSSSGIHDRAIFVDQRGWVTGQSIKDAAAKKPTYLVELGEPVLKATKDTYENIWGAATKII